MAELLNNYIIGLGGTGGKSVAAFRRAVALREQETAALKEKGVHFQYLYIDSNDIDINAATKDGTSIVSEDWSVPGQDLRLSASERLLIDGNGFTLQDAQALPNIQPWFGNDSGVSAIRGTVQGAGQRRRYGRMLLARRAQEVRNTLASGIQTLTAGSKKPQSYSFHIFATLGGGTGSGSIVDLVTYLYSLNTNPRPEIILYLYVGGADPIVKAVDVGFFYQNEYSTLRDLNALICGRWEPDIALVQDGKAVHRDGNPVMAAYVSSENSDTKYNLDVQVERMAAASLDLISLISLDADANVARPFTGEDLVDVNPGECCDSSPKSAWDATGQVPPSEQGDRAERSYRFQTIGVSRCKEPVREIRTVLRSVLAAEVYDRWIDGQKGGNHVTSTESNPDVYRSGRFLGTLDKQLTEYEENILSAFEEKYDSSKVEELSRSLPRLMREETEKLMKAIEQDARHITQVTPGAPTDMQKWCRAEADIQMQHIEAKLKEKRVWGQVAADAATWGVTDIVAYLDDLKANLSKHRPADVPFSSDLGHLAEREKEWRKITWLTSQLFGKESRLQELHYEECRSLLKRALEERRHAILALMEQELAAKVAQLNSVMKNRLTDMVERQKQYAANHREMRQILRSPGSGDVVIYDDTRMEKHVAYLQNGSPEAESDIAQSMAKFEREVPTNAKLSDSIPYLIKTLDDASETVSFWTESRRIHDALVAVLPHEYRPAYHDSVYAALADLPANERGAKYDALMQHKHTLAREHPTPQGGPGLTVLQITSPAHAIASGLPAQVNTLDSDAQKVETEVRQMLKDRVVCTPGKGQSYVSGDSHELRIIECKYWMPVRKLAVLHDVDAVYHRSLMSDNREQVRAMLYFTNIDDKDGKPELIPTRTLTQVHECKLLLEVAHHLLMSGGEAVATVDKDGSVLVCEPRAMQQELVKYASFAPICLTRGDADLVAALKASIEQWLKQHDKAPVLEAMRAEHRAGTAADNDFLFAAIDKLEKFA